MKAVEVNDLWFRFPSRDGEWALAGITLEFAQGEVVGLLGPNGAGKTTLIRNMTGFLKPQRGRVALFGEELKLMHPREMAGMAAVVPQETVVPFPFTCLEIVLMGRAPHQRALGFDTPSDLKAAREAMAVADVLAFADRHINELSGGERQRVIIARAVAQHPRLLIMDEPTAHLDLKHQRDIYELIQSLNRGKGMTVVVVSHDPNLPSAYCHRIVLMKEGRVIGAGSPEGIITRELIQTVYECPVTVERDPARGYPRVSLVLPGRELPL